MRAYAEKKKEEDKGDKKKTQSESGGKDKDARNSEEMAAAATEGAERQSRGSEMAKEGGKRGELEAKAPDQSGGDEAAVEKLGKQLSSKATLKGGKKPAAVATK